jgi:formylglycine-generating enzyme required for sulfatase activity
VISKCPKCNEGKQTCPKCDGKGYLCTACDQEKEERSRKHSHFKENIGLLALSVITTDSSRNIWTKGDIPGSRLNEFIKSFNSKGDSGKHNPSKNEDIVAFIDNSTGFFETGTGMLLTKKSLFINNGKMRWSIDIARHDCNEKLTKALLDFKFHAKRADAINVFVSGIHAAANAWNYYSRNCDLEMASKPRRHDPNMEALLDTIPGKWRSPRPPIFSKGESADSVKPATEKQDVVAKGGSSGKTSAEVPSTVSGIKNEAPEKPVARIKEKPSPKKTQTGVKSASTALEDESAIRFPVWSTFREGPFFPEMVVLPAGTFMMGSNDHESEQPIRQVELKRPFCMGKYPVTCEEYDKFLEANIGRGFAIPGNNQEGRGRHPVSGVSWTDAQAYCEWLSKVTKATYRLPSEAEWEYAARAGTTTRYWWGNDVIEGVPYYGPKPPSRDLWSFGIVGSFAPNPWGIYDLLGSVDQWCQDIHDINNEFTPLDGSPRFNSLSHKQKQELMDRLDDETFFDVKRVRGGRADHLGLRFEIKTLSENRGIWHCDVGVYQGFRVVREI